MDNKEAGEITNGHIYVLILSLHIPLILPLIPRIFLTSLTSPSFPTFSLLLPPFSPSYLLTSPHVPSSPVFTALESVCPGVLGVLGSPCIDDTFRTRSLPAWVRGKTRPLAALDDLTPICEKVRGRREGIVG